MKKRKYKPKRFRIIVVGGGETGARLANVFGGKHRVTIIERDLDRAKSVANKINALVLGGDGTNYSLMKEAGIEKADVVIATTGSDRTNLIVSQIAKSAEVNKIIPVVHAPKNEELFDKLEISTYVSDTQTKIDNIERWLYRRGDEMVIEQFNKGELEIIQRVVSKRSKLVGKKPSIRNAVVIAVRREDKIMLASSKIKVKSGDLLFVAVQGEDVSRVDNLIKK